MSKDFSDMERRILDILKSQERFLYNGKYYYPTVVDKPTSEKGEPKTDIYFEAHCYDDKKADIILKKISFKKQNYDFLENKITAERAKEILGNNWQNIIKEAIKPIQENFKNRKLIFKKKFGNTENGSFTLGWRFEFVKNGGGDLTQRINLTDEQVKDIYAGKNLAEDKRNAIVDGERVKDSGIANCILVEGDYKTTEDILKNTIDIDRYAKEHDEIFFACKASNYRIVKDKIEGNRPLSVFVKWSIKDGKLDGEIVFDEPLEHRSKEIEKQLKKCLAKLNIQSIDDINAKNSSEELILS